MKDTAYHAAWLRARRSELIAEIQGIEHQLDDEAPKDWEDRASERQGDEVLEAMGAHDTAELRQIDAALVRVESGTFGMCVKCGDDIGEDRLAALPATPFCAGCAR